jgi:hypothetical protein
MEHNYLHENILGCLSSRLLDFLNLVLDISTGQKIGLQKFVIVLDAFFKDFLIQVYFFLAK